MPRTLIDPPPPNLQPAPSRGKTVDPVSGPPFPKRDITDAIGSDVMKLTPRAKEKRLPMQIDLPRYTTTNALARIAGTNHGRIGRLVLASKIQPVAILEERGRDVFLYSPDAAGLVAALLLDSTNTTDKQ